MYPHRALSLEDLESEAQLEHTLAQLSLCDESNMPFDFWETPLPSTSHFRSCGRDGGFTTEGTEGVGDIICTYASSPPPSLSEQHTPLPKPLCLPQLNSGPTSPFVRAYSPILADVGISVEIWLQFMYALSIHIISS